MVSSRKHVTRRLSLGFSALFLVMLLAACSLGGSTAASTPTPKPPTPTPTPAIAMKTYTGATFTISYPATWTEQSSGTTVGFQDAQQDNDVAITVIPNPGGTQSASTIATTTITAIEQAGSVKNVQPANLPTTATVGGDSWAQQGITGTESQNGKDVPGELILLVDNHPASSPTTSTYEIDLGGPSLTFTQINSTIFQAMLASFKFTA